MPSIEDEIESFLVELKADPRGDITEEEFEQLSNVMRKLYLGDNDQTIELCDAVCAVIRQKDMTLTDRLGRLAPLFEDMARRHSL